MNKDFSGIIKDLMPEKGYGYVARSNKNLDYYFLISDCHFQVAKGDAVAFCIKDIDGETSAFALRKIYVNPANIVFYARVNRHHIHANLDELLPTIIQRISNNKESFIELEHDFKCVIGKTECVETTSSDEIIYAIRKGHLGHTRFVLNKGSKETSFVFAAFKKTILGYAVVTIFMGRKAEREPYDRLANNASLRFWRNQALIFNPNLIINGSECESNPWILNQTSICVLGNGDE